MLQVQQERWAQQELLDQQVRKVQQGQQVLLLLFPDQQVLKDQ